MDRLLRDATAGVVEALEALSDCPKVRKDAKLYWDAVNFLHDERREQQDNNGPILLATILTYANWLNLTERETDRMVRIVRTVDNHKRSRRADKHSKRAAKAGQ